MKSFDDLVKLLDSNEVFIDDKNSDMFKLSTLLKDVFKAGQQSKQAEIDELRKRIDEALDELQYPTATWDETISHVINILKGTTNEQ